MRTRRRRSLEWSSLCPQPLALKVTSPVRTSDQCPWGDYWLERLDKVTSRINYYIERSVAQYQYISISRGKSSILETLKRENIPVDDYIGFYSLRNWGRVKSSIGTPNGSGIKEDSPPDSATTLVNENGDSGLSRSNSGRLGRKRSRPRTSLASMASRTSNGSGQDDTSRSNSIDFGDPRMEYVTEQVYIHSKLMIVDDKTVICGSGTTFFHLCKVQHYLSNCFYSQSKW